MYVGQSAVVGVGYVPEFEYVEVVATDIELVDDVLDDVEVGSEVVEDPSLDPTLAYL